MVLARTCSAQPDQPGDGLAQRYGFISASWRANTKRLFGNVMLTDTVKNTWRLKQAIAADIRPVYVSRFKCESSLPLALCQELPIGFTRQKRTLLSAAAQSTP